MGGGIKSDVWDIDGELNEKNVKKGFRLVTKLILLNQEEENLVLTGFILFLTFSNKIY